MGIDPQYQETLDYLYSYIDFSLVKTSRYSPERFELGRMRDFMASLGNPQQDYAVLHIAGTKGKGSVAAMCASALQMSGLKVGLYTSPHLEDYAERIQVDGIPIPHEDLIALVEQIKPEIENIPEITTFEITTGLAFLYFARRGVDAAVVEVGLGGRLDATNVCDPHVTVITSISYDHTDLLGDSLAEIAGEKAGILKPGIPLVISPQADEAREVIRHKAADLDVPLIEIGLDVHFRILEKSLSGQRIEVWYAGRSDPGNSRLQLTIPLLGDHQAVNAATAYAALLAARQAGIEVTDEGIQRGFEKVQWPGRFEILRQNPPFIIDSAHNRDSAQKLYNVLSDYFPDQQVVLVFGASEDKDIPGMLTELMPAVYQLVMTQSTHPRAADPQDLVAAAALLNHQAIASSSVEAALMEAERLAAGEQIILVTGSIFVAAAVRSVWKSAVDQPGNSSIKRDV